MSNLDRTANLLTSAQAAELLGVDRATFNRWAAKGLVETAYEIPGRTGARLFDPEVISALVERRRTEVSA